MPTGRELVGAAAEYIGVPYLWGGKTGAGLDCSGLVFLALADVGVTFVHGSRAQIDACRPISVEEGWATPGALLWREGHDAISTGLDGTVEAVVPAVAGLGRSDTYDGGKPRFTRAGLIPGVDYQEDPMSTPVTRAMAHVGQRAYSGLCEMFTRTCFGFPARYSSARLAYEASKRDGAIYGDTNPPAGVPVFFDITSGPNASFDHVAVSVGGGYCVSTSVGPNKSIARVKITDFGRSIWPGAIRYLGWADHYHGRRVWSPPPKGSAPKPKDGYPYTKVGTGTDGLKTAWYRLLGALGYKGTTTQRVQYFLRASGHYLGPIDDVWGAGTTRALQLRLRSSGHDPGPADGVRGPKTRAAEAAYLNAHAWRAK